MKYDNIQIILVGPPGVGKTTIAESIAEMLAQDYNADTDIENESVPTASVIGIVIRTTSRKLKPA